jgi:hypothetical protein
MKQARAPQTFRGRPEQNDRVGRPGLLSFCISISALELEHRFSFLPDGYSRAELAEPLEVFLEE